MASAGMTFDNQIPLTVTSQATTTKEKQTNSKHLGCDNKWMQSLEADFEMLEGGRINGELVGCENDRNFPCGDSDLKEDIGEEKAEGFMELWDDDEAFLDAVSKLGDETNDEMDDEDDPFLLQASLMVDNL